MSSRRQVVAFLSAIIALTALACSVPRPRNADAGLPHVARSAQDGGGIHVAFASLIAQGDGSAQYRVSRALRGVFRTNLINIMFYNGSLASPELPRKAILLLERPDPEFPADLFCAVGMDATHGIVPDIPRNRVRISAASDSELMEADIGRRLSQQEAIAIARRAIESRNGNGIGRSARYEGTRYEFGWIVLAQFIQSDGRQVVGDEVMIVVRDDGKIVQHKHGL